MNNGIESGIGMAKEIVVHPVCVVCGGKLIDENSMADRDFYRKRTGFVCSEHLAGNFGIKKYLEGEPFPGEAVEIH